MKKTLLCLLFVCGTAASVLAQVDRGVVTEAIEKSDSVQYELDLIDGSRLIGTIKFQDETTLLLTNSTFTDLAIPLSKVTSMRRIKSSRLGNDGYWYSTPNSTRYLLGPNAFTLEPGEGYLQSNYAVFNGVHFGVTDNLMIGGGLELISTLSGYPTLYLAPKLGFELAENVNLGIGAIGVWVSDFGEGYGFGYVVSTFGDIERNLSITAGYGNLLDLFDYGPMIGVSGVTRVSRRLALISENWLLLGTGDFRGEADGIMSFGVRVIGRKLSADFAILNNPSISDEFLIGIPYVGLGIQF